MSFFFSLQVDDVLKEDAEKAESLEEVIAELERLQASEAKKESQLAAAQQQLQVRHCPTSQSLAQISRLGFLGSDRYG